MNETAQMQADRLLGEDREARAALRAGHDLETAARAALAAIDRDAKERARPYLDALARLEAAKPPRPMLLTGFDRFEARAAAAGHAVGDRFGRAPFSKADQVRNALLAAFEPETDCSRARLRKLLAAASDATLEQAGRYLKHYADK